MTEAAGMSCGNCYSSKQLLQFEEKLEMETFSLFFGMICLLIWSSLLGGQQKEKNKMCYGGEWTLVAPPNKDVRYVLPYGCVKRY